MVRNNSHSDFFIEILNPFLMFDSNSQHQILEQEPKSQDPKSKSENGSQEEKPIGLD